MSIKKTITVADTQLINGGGDITRDALGLSINSTTDAEISKVLQQKEDTFIDQLKVGHTYNYRLFGNPDLFSTDKHWLSYVFGGQFADETYSGIFINSTFLDHHHIEQNPYSEIEVKNNNTFDTRSPSYISMKPHVEKYYPLYEKTNSQRESVTEIPNAYKIFSENQILSILRRMQNFNVNRSLDQQFELGTIETKQINKRLENICVANDTSYAKIKSANFNSNFLPYYIKTEFNFDSSGEFTKNVKDNNFTHRFIKILKDSFLEEDGAPAPANVQFSLTTEQLDGDGKPSTSQGNFGLKVVDVFDMLQYSLADYNTDNENFDFLFDNSEAANSQYDANSVRRFEKTLPTIKQTNSLISFLNSQQFLSTFEDKPLNLNEKYNEVVAYRIEKIGGAPSGDTFTQRTIQNFWFFNQDDVSRFEFLDNQVSYNQDYEFNIYKYVFIAGVQYSYSNLTLTRTIADLDADHIEGSYGFCLEFFDPSTSESSPPSYNSPIDSTERLFNRLSGPAQVTSGDQYLADFQLTTLPSVKIVEVPIFSKKISILDAPTNAVQVKPSFIVDDSNRLVFNIRYNIHTPSVFPTPIGADEASYKDKFLTSYDLQEGALITQESNTLPITLRIYRTETKPQSLSDFDGKIYSTMNMKVPSHRSTFSTATFYDTVATNKKYYYLFKIVNEVSSPSIGSNTIEAELVSDGGYKFANFKSYFENELPEIPPSTAIKSFKKLINISPNISNVTIDDSGADYSKTAATQLENIKFGSSEDRIWDKKFKIRLTSKKTGKKIDINITHKLVG